MKVSRKWLQKFFDIELPSTEVLAETITFHAFEVESVEGEILDVKILGDRGHDCLSHWGIAKEISAVLKIPFANDPLAQKPSLAPNTDEVSVTLEDATLSPRYIAGYIRNVKVGPSPEWLKKNLESIGQRSINNVVDATNFVMFNLGQPLHAFDAGKLKYLDRGPTSVEFTEVGPRYTIVVRKARTGESLTALDEKVYPLPQRTLVIVDGNADVPVGIAGVKGGMPAGITEETKDIIIESANFSGVSVRKTAQALKLRTDASTRFEQVISPELAGYGMQAAADLILKVANGELVGFADVYPEPQKETRVSVSLAQINKVLGTVLTGAEVADAFTRLQFGYKEERGTFEVIAPFERLDLTISEDLIEEVARIVGYEKVPARELPPFPKPAAVNKNFYTAEHMREELAEKGYSEVYTSVFADKGQRSVLNKVDSVKPYLRESLVPGLTEVLEKNKHNKDPLGLKEVKLFEIGTVWKDGGEIIMLGTVSDKEKATEKPLGEAYKAEVPEKYEALSISTTERYKTFSKYPYIVRDIALWVPADTTAESVLQMIEKEAGELAVKISLFDRFEKGGKTSLAFRIIFQSFERTLTEIEINKVIEKVADSLRSRGFEIR